MWVLAILREKHGSTSKLRLMHRMLTNAKEEACTYKYDIEMHNVMIIIF